MVAESSRPSPTSRESRNLVFSAFDYGSCLTFSVLLLFPPERVSRISPKKFLFAGDRDLPLSDPPERHDRSACSGHHLNDEDWGPPALFVVGR